MPRLSTHLLRQARRQHHLLPLLLRPCRTLDSARNELRWLKEAATARAAHNARARAGCTRERAVRSSYQRHEEEKINLKELCRQRGRGVPLQYLLGTEFFGDLELRVKPGVLIPRQETAAAIIHLNQRLSDLRPDALQGDTKQEGATQHALNILDLCSGTGCMGLLLAYELSKTRSDLRLRVLGVDVSSKAVRLARENTRRVKQEHVSMRNHEIDFIQADMLADEAHRSSGAQSPFELLTVRGEHHWDIVLANPPYLSLKDYFSAQTERSVRCFEPRSALLPFSPLLTQSQRATHVEDTFYPNILQIAKGVQARAILIEVGTSSQACRVARLAMDFVKPDILPRNLIEIWSDDPSKDQREDVLLQGQSVSTIGTGSPRSLFVCLGDTHE